ncbi:MAG TPA: T9SS type A sorting domain-containing protein, partial [Cryomorphaceae bacterium]|nr:T9SS type A sorting domain-containing protein [Cryomorphaceae bacterium]
VLHLLSVLSWIFLASLFSSESKAQSIAVVECNVDQTPHSLRIAGIISSWGFIDRIEENFVSGTEDSLIIDIFFDWCGPPGCCTVYDTTFTLENTFPFYLCVNSYVDSLGVESSCLWSNDDIELFNTLCLSADQILTIEDYSNNQMAKLYPNPADRNLIIDLSHFQDLPNSYLIRDLSGRALSEGKLRDEVERIDVSRLPAGLLILEIQTESGILRQRFVKML